MRIAFLIFGFQLLRTLALAQVDTTYIYNPATPYGELDIRIARSASDYYYLQEGRTFSFRENAGVRTESYHDMTAWDSDLYAQGNMRELVNGRDNFVMNYRILKPLNYNASYPKGYPLALVLHGLQERGNCAGSNCYHASVDYSPNENDPAAPTTADSRLLNNDYNLVHGGSNYLDAYHEHGSAFPDDPNLPARAFPGFVLFPQNLNGWDSSSAQDAIRLVRLMIKKYNIDATRIYINGVSNGGHGAYEVMKRAPWLFAAGVLFSAADDASITEQKLESIIAGIPLWIFQGGVDKKPTPKQTENYIKQLKNAGANVRYTLYPQLGHGTWNKAFSEPDFFTWMLRHWKNNLHIPGDNPVICATTGAGATLSMPQGYSNYQWEYNGQILTAESQYQLIATQPGTYRGRFSNGEWNNWSEIITVSLKNPETARIQQVGTILLKDPNGINEAILKAEREFAHYNWFKDGVLLNFPGQQDDTIQTAKILSSHGDGIYTLQVSDYDNCPSPMSDGKQVYFNDRSPIVISTPKALSLSGNSPSEVSVRWEDTSENEGGFEIWRRKLGDKRDTLWTMAALTDPGVTSFNDINLSPSSSYEYMIRVISTFGRSEYTLISSIETLPDNTPPSAPHGLTIEMTGAQQIKLHWQASSDNSSINDYLIFRNNGDTISTGSDDTTYTIKDFTINTQYSYHIRARDLGDNVSEPSNPANIFTNVIGLFYQHSTGDWSSLEEIDWSIAEFKGIVDDFTLSPKTQEDFFNFRFDGYLHIVKDGVYQFRISSNDGSRLSLDDSLLIINDGIHSLATVTAPIQILPMGPHRITVDFFDNVLGDSLLVEYKGPDSNNEWMIIPSEKLASDLVTSVEEPISLNGLDFGAYPNPSKNGNVNIVFSKISAGPVIVSLLASTGQQLYQAIFNDIKKDEQIRLPELSLTPEGFYIIEVKQDGLRSTKKLVITR